MAAPFKELIRRQTLAPVFTRIAAFSDAFDADAALDEASDGLDDLALKGRVAHVADALRAHLPTHWPIALGQLVASLPPPLAKTSGFESNFCWWPVIAVVERHGLSHPRLSLKALRDMTSRFSAEFAVRPYLEQDPDGALELLFSWMDDPDPHVRRLVSEGTRPRLPWAPVLQGFVADPTPIVPILDALRRDPSLYVRRSVANHLGDLAKDHADRAVAIAQRWLDEDGEDPHTTWVVRHGLRHPVKQGHPGALQLFGLHPARLASARVSVTPDPFVLGGHLTVSVELEPTLDQDLQLDLILRSPSARGGWSRKVFKWTRASVSAGAPWTGEKRLLLRAVTTRKTRPGEHRVALQANGAVVAEAGFTLVVEQP